MVRAMAHDLIHVWPQLVVDAGVRLDGKHNRLYRPNRWLLPLVDTGNPYDNLAACKGVIHHSGFEEESTGWVRICRQAGWKLTWEGWITDPAQPWAPLWSGAERYRVQHWGEITEDREKQALGV